MSKPDETPFLARWARRKQDARRPDADDAAARPTDPAPATKPAMESTAPAHAQLAPGTVAPFDPKSLPNVEDLTSDSDITAFLRKEVPEELKKLALRRMWSLDPQIRDFVEVAENQYDWNRPDGVPGFGPLPEGTDIDALVAHATGHMPKPPPTPADETAAATAPLSSAPPQETLQTGSVRRSVAPSELREPAQPTGDALATSPDASPGPHASEPLRRSDKRRRHGGALPA